MESLAQKFMTVFAGLDTVHGKYTMPAVVEAGKKAKGHGTTIHTGPTEDLWEQHLAGRTSLGVTPINAQNKCVFGAVDIDVYDIDILPLAKILHKEKIPAMVIRSKSGGPQIWVFTKEPVPALLMRTMLQKIAAFLGYGTAEIFPKQSEILVERNDAGCWINMPYFNHERGTRYALDEEGRAMTAQEFLDRHAKLAIGIEEISKFEIKTEDDLADGPPCLQFMIRRGIPEGTRNNVLLNFAVYAKKKNPDGWDKALEDINQKYFLPPLPSSEVQSVIKSAKKKDYNFGCKTQPLMSFCNAALCRTRKFGVGGGHGVLNINSLSKLMTEPPIYFAEIETRDGPKRIELTSEELCNQQRYQKKCIEVLDEAPQIVKQATWTAHLNEALGRVTKIPMPQDVTPKGQFMEHLEKFCAGRAQASSEDGIFLGKPWTNDGAHYFRILDLMAFLERQKFKELNRTQVVTILRDIKGCSYFEKRIKNKHCRLWLVPEFEKQVENFDVPKQPDAHAY